MLGLSKRNFFYNFLIWSIVAVFTATQLYLRIRLGEGTANWWALLKVQLWVWWIWGVITPLVFWLGDRFRVDKTSIWKMILIHLPIAVVIVCFYLAVYSVIWNLESQGNIALAEFWSIFATLFTNLFHWHFFIYMAIIGIVHARSYYMESRDRALKSVQLEKQLLQSQLNFLKMQLQPHFLFNTLNGIVSSIHQGKTTVAANMTTELSELLRISLSGTDRQIITLKEELRHVKTYLNIEKFRFKELVVDYQIPDEILEIEVPNFFLQPIVENAIKHGISQKASAQKISLSAAIKAQSICFKVDNEGPELKTSQDGIGLSNIKKRLHVLFGEEGRLNIHSNENGTTVEIEIPVA